MCSHKGHLASPLATLRLLLTNASPCTLILTDSLIAINILKHIFLPLFMYNYFAIDIWRQANIASTNLYTMDSGTLHLHRKYSRRSCSQKSGFYHFSSGIAHVAWRFLRSRPSSFHTVGKITLCYPAKICQHFGSSLEQRCSSPHCNQWYVVFAHGPHAWPMM